MEWHHVKHMGHLTESDMINSAAHHACVTTVCCRGRHQATHTCSASSRCLFTSRLLSCVGLESLQLARWAVGGSSEQPVLASLGHSLGCLMQLDLAETLVRTVHQSLHCSANSFPGSIYMHLSCFFGIGLPRFTHCTPAIQTLSQLHPQSHVKSQSSAVLNLLTLLSAEGVRCHSKVMLHAAGQQ